MNITIHTFSNSTSSYYKEGRKEYEKRLSRYCKIKSISYKNEKQQQKAIEKIKQISFSAGKDALVFVTAGSTLSNMDSPALASYIEEKGVQGVSNLHFLIGFSETDFMEFSDFLDHLSISNMTISEDLLSLILEEQIYRAYRIMNHEPYHK